ncbi:MAG: Lrp/AsnC family transcriptional regulator [Rhodocyclaceae bacterium]|nr:Lrp/AsnC family transcriptional regulator [Rhodocyclaceae bacterium]
MDSPYSPLEFSLLNEWQRDFPLVTNPFAVIADSVGAGAECRLSTADPLRRRKAVLCETPTSPPSTAESNVLSTLSRLATRGAISRVGAVFAPRRVGVGALAAVAAPVEKIEVIAAQINAHATVNHNYQREHVYNLWFVVTAPEKASLNATLKQIELETGCAVIAMPLAEEFHIDLAFDLHSGHSAVQHCKSTIPVQRELDVAERRLAAQLQDGLKLCPQPYAELAMRANMSEGEVLGYLQRWQDEGLIKRFGIVVRHHEMGYRSNAMVVFDIPDDTASAVGAALAKTQGVTLAYRRERCLPAWPYNIYCMVHGRSRTDVLPIIEHLASIAGAAPTVLFSVRRFKQCGARYF